MLYDTLFCKVFVHSNLSIESLEQLISSALQGERRSCEIITKTASMSVCKNTDSAHQLVDDPIDGFLYYRHFVEIEPLRGVNQDMNIAEIGRMLQVLWDSGASAVAACDFENELPRNGGYNPAP